MSTGSFRAHQASRDTFGGVPRRIKATSSIPLPLDVPEREAPAQGGVLEVPAAAAEAAMSAASAAVKSEFETKEEADLWASSEFVWLRNLPSARRGKAGVALVEVLLRGVGFDVDERQGTGHDRVVSGVKLKVKFSTLWAAGVYNFQQIKDEDYDYLLLLGVSPTRAHAWLVGKQVALENAQPNGTQGSWLTIEPGSQPQFLTTDGALDGFLAHLPLVFGEASVPHGPARIDTCRPE